jgi:hypothetical protein
MPGFEPGIQTLAINVWMAGSIPGSRPGKAMTAAARAINDPYLENFLYFSRCGMTLSMQVCIQKGPPPGHAAPSSGRAKRVKLLASICEPTSTEVLWLIIIWFRGGWICRRLVSSNSEL